MMYETASLPANQPYTSIDESPKSSIIRDYWDMNCNTASVFRTERTTEVSPNEPNKHEIIITHNKPDPSLDSVTATILEVENDYVKVELPGNNVAKFPIELFSNCGDLDYGKTLKYEIAVNYLGYRYQKLSSMPATGLEIEKADLIKRIENL
ncbi:MAG: hypothetical protein JNL74_17600 [Fibrobacteres bacterium]|nr:hypothetical protein [Fibrobacterota bacterium]